MMDERCWMARRFAIAMRHLLHNRLSPPHTIKSMLQASLSALTSV